VNHFQGRVSCKYGQTAPANDGNCVIPGSDRSQAANHIQQVVSAQLQDRTADKAVYCSCRCDGDDKNARYCKCPSGYACSHLVNNLNLGGGQLAGSYCVRDGTAFAPSQIGTDCSPAGYPTVPLAAGSSASCGAADDG